MMFKRTSVLALALIGLVSFAGLGSSVMAASAPNLHPTTAAIITQPVDMEDLDVGDQSGIGKNFVTVIKDQQTLDELWKTHKSVYIPVPAAPQVDFTKKMVVGVFIGTRSNASYSMNIEKIEQTDHQITVWYHEHTPLPGTLSEQTLVSPYQVVTIDKSDKPVMFRGFVDMPPRIIGMQTWRYMVMTTHPISADELQKLLAPLSKRVDVVDANDMNLKSLPNLYIMHFKTDLPWQELNKLLKQLPDIKSAAPDQPLF